MSLYDDLRLKLPQLDIRQNSPLAPYTTLRIGGPAECLVVVTKQSELFSILKFISQQIVDCKLKIEDFRILGKGSDLVISDSGLPGLTIINRASQIHIHPKVEMINGSTKNDKFSPISTQRNENEPEKYLDFGKIDYDESGLPTQLVTLQAGTPLPFAINQLLNEGLTGLQWFAYIPGTVGGAVYQNIHGGKYHFSDYIDSIKTFNLKTGKTQLFKKTDLNWHYETSFFQSNYHLIILSATLRLFRGDANLARQVTTAWIAQKTKVQPMNSAGSVFANPSPEICQKIWGEQKSAGWIIDHELGWKGKAIGGAQISPLHSNFIVNTGTATAKDYHSLVKQIIAEVKTRFDFELIPEIKFLGQI
ncbi:FAD-binding protein [Candidatus Shapirobacteria bacterium]|nr:FAD-binding protein [Candidatus Shapirobacteria bacterium]